MTASRGTSNGNQRGSAADRRRRRAWLITTYRANVDLMRVTSPINGVVIMAPHPNEAAHLIERCAAKPGSSIDWMAGSTYELVPACRCYRCGTLLHDGTVTVDRIVPGCVGGTYRRDNIRPACGTCNSETGGKLSRTPKPKRRARIQAAAL